MLIATRDEDGFLLLGIYLWRQGWLVREEEGMPPLKVDDGIENYWWISEEEVMQDLRRAIGA